MTCAEREAELYAEGCRVAENCRAATKRIGRDRYVLTPSHVRLVFKSGKLARRHPWTKKAA